MHTFRACLLVLAIARLAVSTHAATITWNVAANGSGNWSNTNSWAGGVVPTATDATVFANNAGTTVNIDPAGGVSVLGAQVNRNTTFAGNTLTLSSSTNVFGSGVLSFSGGSSITFNAPLTYAGLPSASSAALIRTEVGFGGAVTFASPIHFGSGQNGLRFLLLDVGGNNSTPALTFNAPISGSFSSGNPNWNLSTATINLNAVSSFSTGGGSLSFFPGNGTATVRIGASDTGGQGVFGQTGNLIQLGTSDTAGVSGQTIVLQHVNSGQTLGYNINCRNQCAAVLSASFASGTSSFTGTLQLNNPASGTLLPVRFEASAGATLLISGQVRDQNGTGQFRAVTKNGLGTVALTASNTFAGGVTVTAGTLAVNNTTGSGTGTGPVLVQTNAVLAGSGAIAGAVTLQNGGAVSPGYPVGTLTLNGGLTLNAGARGVFEVGPAFNGANDLLVINGNLSASSNVIQVAGPTLLDTNGAYVLISYTGAASGTFNPAPQWLGTAPGNAAAFAITNDSVAKQIRLQYFPPPGTPTTTTVSSSLNPATYGLPVVWTAMVTPLTATGTVQFVLNGTNFGSPVDVVSGLAKATNAALPAGTHTVTAQFTCPTPDFWPSSGSLPGGQVVARASQTVTFNLGNSVVRNYSDRAFADVATASSGLPVVYASDNTSVAIINSSGGVTLIGPGTAILSAGQSGDANYEPAPTANQTLTVLPATPPAGTVFYVATNGNDSSSTPWNINTPYRTISAAAAAAWPGDTVLIRGGVYRETVTPARSGTSSAPITFQAHSNETVVISAADVIPANTWTAYDLSGTNRIYRAPMNWDMSDMAGPGNSLQVLRNQVFVDGQMMVEARWPNVPPEIITRLHGTNRAVATGGSGPPSAGISTSTRGIYYADLSAFAPNSLAGARLSAAFGRMWWQYTGIVLSNTAGSVTFSLTNSSQTITEGDFPQQGNFFHIWGSLALLDYPGEWHRDKAAGYLYLWTPDGSSPALHLVEAKRRDYAFDLRSRSFIRLIGLQTFAGALRTDTTSDFNEIRDCQIYYVGHIADTTVTLNTSPDPRWWNINGHSNLIADCLFLHSADKMLNLSGQGNVAVNNVIGCVGYAGAGQAVGSRFAAGTLPADGSRKNQFIQNMVFTGGHSLADMSSALDIAFNDFYNSHRQGTDIGSVSTWGTDGLGAEISYNAVHTARGVLNMALNYYGGHGIYLDCGTRNYVIHHNVIWDTTSGGLQAIEYNCNGFTNIATANRRLFNNTVDGDLGARFNNGTPGTEFINNLAKSFPGAGSANPAYWTISNNFLFGATDPGFFNRAQNDYRLLPDSAAVDYGVLVSGQSVYYTGAAPDAGAHEGLVRQWVPGALVRSQDLAALTVQCLTNSAGSYFLMVSNLPPGRKLPLHFAVRIGTDAPVSRFINQTDYATMTTVGMATWLNPQRLTGLQPVAVQLAGGPWVQVGSVNVGAGPAGIAHLGPMVLNLSGVPHFGWPLFVDTTLNDLVYQLSVSDDLFTWRTGPWYFRNYFGGATNELAELGRAVLPSGILITNRSVAPINAAPKQFYKLETERP